MLWCIHVHRGGSLVMLPVVVGLRTCSVLLAVLTSVFCFTHGVQSESSAPIAGDGDR